MSPSGIQEPCLELAEHLLADELDRPGTSADTSARVLSLAAAIQKAVDIWSADNPDEATS